jgi:hypothetical protein
MVIKRVNPISAAKIFGTLGVVLGLVIGAFVTLFALMFRAAVPIAADEPGAGFMGLLVGAGAIIILPIFYGVFMFIVGLIQAAVFNLAAKWTGGLEIDVA